MLHRWLSPDGDSHFFFSDILAGWSEEEAVALGLVWTAIFGLAILSSSWDSLCPQIPRHL
jgi:hypothetical protein